MGKFADQLKSFELRAEGLAERTLRLAVLEVWQRLVLRSPVDTGRFRAAWTLATSDVVKLTHFRPQLPEGVYGPPEPPVIREELLGTRIFISNNLPYGRELEDGGSQQAPNGMVKLTALEWPQIVRAAVAAARAAPETGNV